MQQPAVTGQLNYCWAPCAGRGEKLNKVAACGLSQQVVSGSALQPAYSMQDPYRNGTSESST
jgi:hypothetical protein